MKIQDGSYKMIKIIIWNIENESRYVWTCDSEHSCQQYLDKMIPNLFSKNRINIERNDITTYEI